MDARSPIHRSSLLDAGLTAVLVHTDRKGPGKRSFGWELVGTLEHTAAASRDQARGSAETSHGQELAVVKSGIGGYKPQSRTSQDQTRNHERQAMVNSKKAEQRHGKGHVKSEIILG